MKKGFILYMLLIYLAASTVLCGVLLKSVQCFLISYKRLNNQALLARSMIVGTCLLHRIAPSEDIIIKPSALYWRYPWDTATHALVLKNNTLWYMQGTYNNGVFTKNKKRMVLMQYVQQIVFEPTLQGLHYSIRLAYQDQSLKLQAIL